MKAELIIRNGTVRTMNRLQPFAQALAIGKGKLIAVGSNEEIMAFATTDTRVIDACGNSVLPGFFDVHTHFTGTGLNATAVDLTDVTSHDELFSALRAKNEALPPGVCLRGFGYNETKFAEKELPPQEALDKMFGERPVFLIRVDAHSCYLNQAAFRLLDIREDLEGVIKEGGVFTGVLRAKANSVARKKLNEQLMTDEMRYEALRYSSDIAVKVGVTTVHALEGGSLFADEDVKALLKYQDRLDVQTVVYHQNPDVDLVKSEGLCRIGGCITVDGSLGSHTAALLEPYSDAPDSQGILYYSQKEIDDVVMEAHTSGMQIAMHTIGDAAIERLLTAYEKALAKHPRSDHRHRFEHFSVPTYEQMQRAKAIGAYISVQPSFVYYAKQSSMTLDRLGPDRIRRLYPFADLLNAGLMLAGGSDSDITPISPLLGIHACLSHFDPIQNLSLYEALKLFTSHAAYFAFEEKDKGTLEVGKQGDVVILQGNIEQASVQEIKDMKVQNTIVKGKVVYECISKS